LSNIEKRPIVYDMSRLVTRFSRLVPNGIDRVDIGYADHFFNHHSTTQAMVLGPVGVRVADNGAGRAVVNAIARHWREHASLEDDREFAKLRMMLGDAESQALPPIAGDRRTGVFSYAAELLGGHALFGRRQLFPGRDPARTVPPNAIYLNTSQFPLWIDWYFRWLDRRPDVKPVFFVHDHLPIQYPEFFPPDEVFRHTKRIAVLSRRAKGVIVASEATKQALLSHLARLRRPAPPIAVIALPVSDHFFHAPTSEAIAAPVPFFVTLGTIEPRKNHLLLLQIWRELANQLGPKTPKLLIVGVDGWHNDNALDLLERCEAIRPHVLRTSRLSTPGLRAIMANARAMLMPTFAEGYGLPVVEAAAAGVPVIASSIPPFQRQTSDLVTLIDPLDGPGWRDAIMELLNEHPVSPTKMRSSATALESFRWVLHMRHAEEFLGSI